MLRNDFYALTNWTKGEESHLFSVELNASHRLYDGHFEGQPVVPGVCSLQMIKECAEQLSGKTYRYAYISSAKFLSLVDPVNQPQLVFTLTLQETGDGCASLSAEGKFLRTDTVFIKVKATLKEMEHA